MFSAWTDRVAASVYRLKLRGQISGRTQKNHRITNPWHAVSVECQGNGGSCDPARALKGRRFLSAQAPALPLTGCDRPEDCSCRYAHHEDRRHGLRRSGDGGPPRGPYHGPERRGIAGRRETDL